MSGGVLGRLPNLPVPDFYDLRWAARSSKLTGKQSARWALGALGVELLLLLAAVVLVPLQLTWVAVACWVAAALVDRWLTGFDSTIVRLMTAVGVTAALRATLRAVIGLVLLVALPLAASITFVVVVIAVQVALAGLNALSQWLFSSQVPLAYQVGAPTQGEVFRRYAAVYAGVVGVPLALTAAEALALAGGLLGVPVWAGLLAVLLVAATGARTVLQARALRRGAARNTQQVLDEVAAGSPGFIFYVGASMGMAGHIANQWLPVFDRVPIPGFVMVRGASELSALAPSRLPVIYAAGARQVEQLTLPGVRAAFYQSFALRNANLLRDPALVHVMLNHGDSDKASSHNRQAGDYDELWVAGPIGVERFRAAGVDLDEAKFVMVGRPQVEGLAVGPLTHDGQPPVVLYAPTWEGYYEETNHTSLDRMGEGLIRWLLARPEPVRVWFKPHPASGRLRPAVGAASERIKQLLLAAGPQHVLVEEAGVTLPEALSAADVLVTDVSSVASDYLATRRPLVVTDPQGLGATDFAARYASLTSAYVIDADLSNLADVFADALGADPLAAARRETESRVLGDHAEGPQQTFNREVTRIAGHG